MQDSDEIMSAHQYRLREIPLPNRETPYHQQRDSDPLRRKANIPRLWLTESPSVLPVLLPNGDPLLRRLMRCNNRFMTTNATHLLNSLEERA